MYSHPIVRVSISFVNVFLPSGPAALARKARERDMFLLKCQPRLVRVRSRLLGSSVLAVYSREDILLDLQLALD